jgi:hypothetical protein
MTQAFVYLCRARVRTTAVVHDSAYTSCLGAGHEMTALMHRAIRDVCPAVAEVAPVPEWEVRPTFF